MKAFTYCKITTKTKMSANVVNSYFFFAAALVQFCLPGDKIN